MSWNKRTCLHTAADMTKGIRSAPLGFLILPLLNGCGRLRTCELGHALEELVLTCCWAIGAQTSVQSLQRKCEQQSKQLPEQALRMLEDAETALRDARQAAVAAQDRAAQLQADREAAESLAAQLQADREAAGQRSGQLQLQLEALQQQLLEQQRQTAGNHIHRVSPSVIQHFLHTNPPYFYAHLPICPALADCIPAKLSIQARVRHATPSVNALIIQSGPSLGFPYGYAFMLLQSFRAEHACLRPHYGLPHSGISGRIRTAACLPLSAHLPVRAVRPRVNASANSGKPRLATARCKFSFCPICTHRLSHVQSPRICNRV